MTRGIPDFRIPVGDWVESGVDWIQVSFTGVLDSVAEGLGLVIGSFEDALLALPPLLLDRITQSFGRRSRPRRGIADLARLLGSGRARPKSGEPAP
ncbi:MAG: hypothetical protein WAK53_19085 [Chromatiaceae bacterium]|jgi:ABC-type proline/glycine betaine transport system permease subunit